MTLSSVCPLLVLLRVQCPGTLLLLVLLWKRRQVTDVLWATVTLVGALEFLRSYW